MGDKCDFTRWCTYFGKKGTLSRLICNKSWGGDIWSHNAPDYEGCAWL